MNKIKLKLTPNQAAVIFQFLWNTRLGSRNEFESEISDLMIKMEQDGIQGYLEEHVPNLPKIKVECSEDEGMVFNIEE
jgi:hypothetical protein